MKIFGMLFLLILSLFGYLFYEYQYNQKSLGLIVTKIYPKSKNWFPSLNRPPLPNEEHQTKEEESSPPPVREDFLSKEEAFMPLCEQNPPPEIQTEHFTECASCPQYLYMNEDLSASHVFLQSYFRGSFVNPPDKEILVFMKGCGPNTGYMARLTYEYGGYKRTQVSTPVYFQSKPLLFQTTDGKFVFVGKRETSTTYRNKEELIVVEFFKESFQEKILFTSHYHKGESCNGYLQSDFSFPVKKNNTEFSVKLEVIGRDTELFPSFCLAQKTQNDVLQTPRPSTSDVLQADTYELHFMLRGHMFEPTKSSSMILTKWEESQEE